MLHRHEKGSENKFFLVTGVKKREAEAWIIFVADWVRWSEKDGSRKSVPDWIVLAASCSSSKLVLDVAYKGHERDSDSFLYVFGLWRVSIGTERADLGT